MYRLYYECRLGNLFVKKRTCFSTLNQMIEQLCKWNTQPNSKYVYIPIDWASINVSPLEDEIFPNTMEHRDAA